MSQYDTAFQQIKFTYHIVNIKPCLVLYKEDGLYKFTYHIVNIKLLSIFSSIILFPNLHIT